MIEFGYKFGFGQSGLVTPGFVLRDTFTDADGTNLTAHTMNVGPGWTVADGTFEINANNQVQATVVSGSQAKATAISDAGIANISLACNLYTGDANGVGLNLRYKDTGSFWNAALATSANELRIFQIESGLPTERAAVALTLAPSTWYTLTFTADGNALTATVGASSCNYTSTYNNDQTSHGIRSTSTSQAFDNFEAKA